VSVESKNLLPREYVTGKIGETVDRNGIKYTVNTDGSITLNGKNNGNGDSAFFLFGKSYGYVLRKGTYVANNNVDGASFTLYIEKTNKYPTLSTPYTVEQDTNITQAYITVRKGSTKEFTGETFYPMLMRGTVVEEYTPPVGDLSSVTLTKHGKNIVDYSNHKVTASGAAVFNGREITLTQDKDGNPPSIIFYLGNYDDFVGKTLTLSCTLLSLDGATRASDAFYFGDVTKDGNSAIIGNAAISSTSSNVGVRRNITVTVPEMDAKGKQLTIRHYLVGATAIGDAGTIKDLQVEIGDTMTEYEEGKEPIAYTPNADGTVEGVTSVYPTTTLMTGNDICISAEYNKDTNKVIENLVSAIISLGGNV
jgi:hypothetical protein